VATAIQDELLLQGYMEAMPVAEQLAVLAGTEASTPILSSSMDLNNQGFLPDSTARTDAQNTHRP
jgi:hypothetical protein